MVSFSTRMPREDLLEAGLVLEHADYSGGTLIPENDGIWRPPHARARPTRRRSASVEPSQSAARTVSAVDITGPAGRNRGAMGRSGDGPFPPQ